MENKGASPWKAGQQLDCSWHLCPVPILMTEEKVAAMRKGETLEVIFTDPGAKPDLDAWCRGNGHELLGFGGTPKKMSAFIRKK
jgi:tRNA 2-thiouridine synthesizing protein A